MVYIFEGVVKFDVNDCSLTHTETSDYISLAKTGVILLEYLIKNQGVIVGRNLLLDDIFKKNDRTDSDCNLSQTLSMLRKGFRDLGLNKDILVTKPRVGLLLPEEVTIEFCSEEKPHNLLKKVDYKVHIVFFSMLILLATAFFYSNAVQKEYSFFTIKSSSIEPLNIHGCKVYILNKEGDAEKRISALIRKESLPCEGEDSIYYLDNSMDNGTIDSLVHCRTLNGTGEVCAGYVSRREL